MAKKSDKKPGKQVEALRHKEDKRRNIPTAEHQSVIEKTEEAPRQVRYPRNTDLDPQLVWRGKDYQDWTDLVVPAPPLYIQEKIHPKVLIDDLMRQSRSSAAQQSGAQIDLFADFNGIPEGVEKTEFYQHDQNWSNRMILGDSLQVMASLAEREGLRGKVQCIYFDPPYGIRFNSNFQWSTTSRTVTDGKVEHITREPEQVKAFRDTWRDGVHSYLTYLRDRLTVARDLLSDSGSIFVQIGDENVHRVRAVMDEVFGDANCVTEILVKKKGSQKGGTLDPVNDFILWYSKSAKTSGGVKTRPIYEIRTPREMVDDFPFVEFSDGRRYRTADLLGQQDGIAAESAEQLLSENPGARLFAANPLKSGGVRRKQSLDFIFQGRRFPIKPGQCWKHTVTEDDARTPGMTRLAMANRLVPQQTDVRFVRHSPDPSIREISNWWDGFGGAPNQVYVVQTNERIVQRCLLMATDPGDLVLDPTCGSGTTAQVAEQWGRRWITIDTSRVALALARARLMGARYPFYLLMDSADGQAKEAEVSSRELIRKATYGNVRLGFVCERVKNITSASIANDAEIDVIHERWRSTIDEKLAQLNKELRGKKVAFSVTNGGRAGIDVRFDAPAGSTFTMPAGEIVSAFELLEWEIPREAPSNWPIGARAALADLTEAQASRQRELDASILAKGEYEHLFDRPYEDRRKVRVAGPFTVESLSPHRTLGVGVDDELIDPLAKKTGDVRSGMSFEQMILENLKAAGVQQTNKDDRITFTSLVAWPGRNVCGEGRYREGNIEKRAAILIGPEFGTVGRADLVSAAREAGDAGFDVLVACAFSYEAHAAEFNKLGRIPVLKARMNADLHMAGDLKATDKANLFVVFGEPDIEIHHQSDGQIFVEIRGVDVFDPSTGEVRSDRANGIACWFIDSDYNEESFFVRHAYFLGQNDPYSALRTTLKAEINVDAWATLHSDTSRPFPKPTSGRIAVKVINHLGDEVMKVFVVR